MVGHKVFRQGLPMFPDCSRSFSATAPKYLRCSCGDTQFYRLQSINVPYDQPFQVVYICMGCCTFYTVENTLKYKSDPTDIEAVSFSTWRKVELVDDQET